MVIFNSVLVIACMICGISLASFALWRIRGLQKLEAKGAFATPVMMGYFFSFMLVIIVSFATKQTGLSQCYGVICMIALVALILRGITYVLKA